MVRPIRAALESARKANVASRYACPFCRATVRAEPDSYLCPDCRRVYPVNHGIPDFSSREHYWNHLDADQMEFMLEITRSHGYRYAVENILGKFRDPELVRYALGANRADFRTVLPITPQARIVDLGAGWGAIACALAPHCESVTAMDTNPYTLRFIAMRAEQEQLANIEPVRMDPLDDCRIPAPDHAFDIAIMNGVLEYVGSASSQGSPYEAQVRALQETRRILKPGGFLYVGIENRFGYLYFLGTKDHIGLRYTSLMPRWMAQAITWLRKRMPYRTYTYSYRGYRRLLEASGFSKPSTFLAVPNYRDPRFIVPADDDRAIAYLVRRYASYFRRRSWRWAANALFGHTPPSLCGALARAFSDSFLLVAEARP
jgi:ubiquinone/menaquinone biosynthesis C-methylase UbiE